MVNTTGNLPAGDLLPLRCKHVRIEPIAQTSSVLMQKTITKFVNSDVCVIICEGRLIFIFEDWRLPDLSNELKHFWAKWMPTCEKSDKLND